MGPKRAATSYEGINRRRWSRYAVDEDIPTTLVVGGQRLDCVIEDVSLAGAKLRIAGKVPSGAIVQLRCDASDALAGRCVWAGPKSIGVSFGLCERSVDFALSCLRRMPAIAESLALGQPAEAAG
jgi:hypothetical protein